MTLSLDVYRTIPIRGNEVSSPSYRFKTHVAEIYFSNVERDWRVEKSDEQGYKDPSMLSNAQLSFYREAF